MVRKRFKELEPQRKERILDAAAEEFAARGYDGASVNRIIAAAGISKGVLYYYFDDKEDLFATVLELATARMMNGTGFPPPEDLTAETFWNTFRDLMRRSVEYLKSNEWHVRLAQSFHARRVTSPHAASTQRMLDLGREQVRIFLARGQELRVVRTDLPLALLVELTMAVDVAGDRWRVDHWDEFSHDQHRQQADAHIDVIRDMLHARNQGWEGN